MKVMTVLSVVCKGFDLGCNFSMWIGFWLKMGSQEPGVPGGCGVTDVPFS